jgi:Rieske 2Fe-2S family protein
MAKKVSRRDFARTSVAAGAAAVALPDTLLGRSAPDATVAEQTPTAARGAAVARQRRVTIPEGLGYGGGGGSDFGRGTGYLSSSAFAGQTQTRTYPGGWHEGTTIPAEYYVAEKHYLNDERFLGENLWLMVDHESRIPKTGDYFVFEYGRGDSIIIARDTGGAVKAYHNVCRHRGSRLCRHDDDPAPKDARLSVRQLGSSGNTPVFRCPYHAWTYDIDGRLVSAYGMPSDFDQAANGLLPCHVQAAEGFIFVNLSTEAPPDFESAVKGVRTLGQRYGTKDLKVAARIQYPTKANWKLALENFLECYHCGPAHRSLVTTHDWDYSISAEQKAQREKEIDRWVPSSVRPGRPGSGGGMGQTENLTLAGRGWLMPGKVTGSLDGKPVAPLLPNFKEYTHGFRETTTGWSTAYWAMYDDYVAVARFTPRDVAVTDAEIIWLVNPSARESKDYQVDRLTALWDVTMREDKWVVENNHIGVLSGGYRSGRYAVHELGNGGPAAFIKWYMGDVVVERQTEALAGR